MAEAAFALGRQTNVSISFQGAGVGNRRVPAIRGRMTPHSALSRIAAAGGLEVRAVGPRAFILAPRRSPMPVVARIAQRATPPAPRPLVVTTPDEKPQDIVVTASKLDTLFRRFAGQWSRIDGADLSGLGVTGTDAIDARTVGFTSTHLGSGRNKLFIRGIADSSFSGPTQSTVGQYLGDLRTGYSGPDPDLRLVDLQSVEVLEGPQGTLYGAGALGGIVLLKPNMPEIGKASGTSSAGLSLTQHGEPGADVAGSVNLPVGASAALRLTGYRAVDGGYVDNSLTGEEDVNRLRVGGVRLIATARPDDEWAVDLTGTAQWISGDDSQYADRGGDRLTRASAIDQPFESDFELASVVVRKDRGSIRARSTIGATWQDVAERFDASLPGTPRMLRQQSSARSISSETRVWRPMRNGYSWLAGVSFLRNRYRVTRMLAEGERRRDLAGAENRLRELTFYGELGVELSPTVEVSGGARYTMSELEGSGQHLSFIALDRLAASDPRRTERRLLPSASVLVRPFDGLSLYARYQQGFRPGGLSVANDAVRFYRNDRLGTAEAGFRFGRPRSDRLDLSGSLTWSRWQDIQADYLDVSGLPVTDNIGDGRVWSAVLSGGYRLAPSLRLEAGLAWNDGRITRPSAALLSLAPALALSAKEMPIPNVARVVTRAAIDWSRELGPDRRVEVNLYGRYVGRSRLGVGPRLGEAQGDYFDSGLIARYSVGRAAFSLSVTNLADQVGNRFAFGSLGQDGNQLTPLRPRTARIGVEWAF